MQEDIIVNRYHRLIDFRLAENVLAGSLTQDLNLG